MDAPSWLQAEPWRGWRLPEGAGLTCCRPSRAASPGAFHARLARGAESKRFLVALRGYDKDEVDAFLKEVATDQRQLLQRLEKASHTAADPAADLLDDLAVQVAAIARAAAAAVAETRADAEREAAGVQAAARAELARAENLRADAKREAAEQLDAAQAELALAKMVRGDADADHSPKFWSSVATYFKANPAVVFDLYNEPHVGSWACWRDGCTSSAGWRTAGMQALVNARPVRRDAGDVLGLPALRIHAVERAALRGRSQLERHLLRTGPPDRGMEPGQLDRAHRQRDQRHRHPVERRQRLARTDPPRQRQLVTAA